MAENLRNKRLLEDPLGEELFFQALHIVKFPIRYFLINPKMYRQKTTAKTMRTIIFGRSLYATN